MSNVGNDNDDCADICTIPKHVKGECGTVDPGAGFGFW